MGATAGQPTTGSGIGGIGPQPAAGGKGGTGTNVPAGKGGAAPAQQQQQQQAYNPGANTFGQDPTRFNAQGYLNAYPDLQKAFGTDTAAAQQHYNQFGKAEGRTVPGYEQQYNPVTANNPQPQNPQSNLNLPQGGFTPNYGMYNNQPPMLQPLNPNQANINYAPQQGQLLGQLPQYAQQAYGQQLATAQQGGMPQQTPGQSPLQAVSQQLRGLPQNAGQMPQAPTQHRMGRRDERQEAQRAMQQFRPGMGRNKGMM